MQMIKKYWIYMLFIVALIVFGITQYNKKKNADAFGNIEVKTKQNTLGWGYEIYAKNKLVISQIFIPSIAGNKAFATEDEAKKVGELMVFKIKKNRIPDVTEHELDSLQINR